MTKSEEKIDCWGVIELYSRACKRESWLEAISLGYTLLETQLIFLLTKTKVGIKGMPLKDKDIQKCRYLLDLAALAKKEGFISDDIYVDIENFNKVRKKAIHKLTSGEITYKEIADTAKSTGKIFAKIQDLYLKIKVVVDENINDIEKGPL